MSNEITNASHLINIKIKPRKFALELRTVKRIEVG